MNKLPLDTDVLSDNIQEDNDGYIKINNFTHIPPPIPQDSDVDEIRNKNIKPHLEYNFKEGNRLIINKEKDINENKNEYLNSPNNTNEQFLNNINNSNMNMNITTSPHLFINQEDDMDVFPNYPRPSLGTSNNTFQQEFSNMKNFN